MRSWYAVAALSIFHWPALNRTLELGHAPTEVHEALGNALVHGGETQKAVEQYREVIRLQPDSVGAMNNLAWMLATAPEATLRNGPEAIRLAERAADLTRRRSARELDTLAAAYAEAGRFPEAIETGERARAAARAAGETGLVQRNQELLELYRAGKACHEAHTE